MNEIYNSSCILPMTYDDIPDVMGICGDSFPESIRWRGNYSSGRRWWKGVLKMDSCAVLKFTDNDCTIGFVALVVDVNRFKKEKKHLSIGFDGYLLAVLFHPILSMRAAMRMLKNRISVDMMYEDNRRLSEQVGDYMGIGEIAWIELIAVKPDARGRRISSKLIHECKKIAEEQNKRAIILRVDTKNQHAIDVYEKLGFGQISKSNGQSTFVLNL